MQTKPGKLYIVATPIGNKEDITLRAIKILGEVDFIAAEDTRHTGRLLTHHRVKSRLISYHEHNEAERTPDLLKKLMEGSSIAVVSNAGTPSVSDPGYRLVKEAIESGIMVIPIPGASAAIAALSVAGLPTDSFVFMGFPARKKGKRLKALSGLIDENKTMIFYESPKRILTLLKEIIMVMGDRYGVLSREMTKIHEEFIRGNLSEILNNIQQRLNVKGECTLLVMGREENEDVGMETVRSEIKQGLKVPGSRPSDIAKEIAKKFKLPKKKVYQETLKIKGENR